ESVLARRRRQRRYAASPDAGSGRECVVALRFEIGKEGSDLVRRQVRERQLGNGAMGRSRQKEQEQPETIAVAAKRRRRDALLGFELVFEVLVDQTTDGGHDQSPFAIGPANRPKRCAAASRSSLVTVR